MIPFIIKKRPPSNTFLSKHEKGGFDELHEQKGTILWKVMIFITFDEIQTKRHVNFKSTTNNILLIKITMMTKSKLIKF